MNTGGTGKPNPFMRMAQDIKEILSFGKWDRLLELHKATLFLKYNVKSHRYTGADKPKQLKEAMQNSQECLFYGQLDMELDKLKKLKGESGFSAGAPLDAFIEKETRVLRGILRAMGEGQDDLDLREKLTSDNAAAEIKKIAVELKEKNQDWVDEIMKLSNPRVRKRDMAMGAAAAAADAVIDVAKGAKETLMSVGGWLWGASNESSDEESDDGGPEKSGPAKPSQPEKEEEQKQDSKEE